MLMEADLSEDIEALRVLVLEQARELDALKVFKAEVERLKAIIDALQRHRFGRRSEQLDPDQFELALEEVEAALAQAEHARDKASRTPIERPRKTNRGSLPGAQRGSPGGFSRVTRAASYVRTRPARPWRLPWLACRWRSR